MKSKPLRKCVACGEKKEKHEFIMISRSPKNNLESITYVSRGRNKDGGRSVYICPSENCFAKAKKLRRFEKSLKSKIPLEVYDQVERMIEDFKR